MMPAFHSLVGTRVERYEVLAQLGQGGFGAVYRARHAVLGTEVALKVLWPDRADDPEAVERFMREARAAATIGSPHIVSVGDAGTTADGVVFLTMELLQGHDLERELQARGRLPAHEAIDILRQVLAALSAAHARGIVHRDLKPANAFLVTGPDGAPFVKLLDFGVSKITGAKSLTATGVALGTPQYMAPEQLEGARTIDGRVDVYAAGCMLYELLSGRVPFEGAGVDVLVRRLAGAKPPPLRTIAPHVDEALAAVTHRALAFDRDARWPSAAAMADALLAAEDGSLLLEAEATVPPASRWVPMSGANAPAESADAQIGITAAAAYPPRSAPAIIPATSAPSAYAVATPIAGLPAHPPASAPSTPPSYPPNVGAMPAASTPVSYPPNVGAAAAASTPVSYPPNVGAAAAASTPVSHRPNVGASTPVSYPPNVATSAPSRASPVASSVPSAIASPRPSGRSRVILGTLGVLALLLMAAATGALGVGAYRRFGHESKPHSDVAAPAESPREDRSPPERDSAGSTVIEPAPMPPPVDPAGVRYRVVEVVGTGPRSEVDAILERARIDVARCGTRGRALHLAVSFIATWAGHVSIAGASQQRPSDDAQVAACVGRAIAAAGPMRFFGPQTAIVEVDVDLPAR